MGRWKLWFVLLLLLLPFCTGKKAFQEHCVKTIGEEVDITPICTNTTVNVILLIVCKIHTERSRGQNCILLYRIGQDFVHECDSRFTLMKENQTVFLHLTNLTPEDSGNYTCECTNTGGTYKLHLNVTVEEKGDNSTTSSTEDLFFYALTGVPVFMIISGVILGLIYNKKCHGRHQVAVTTFENTELYTQAEHIEPYNDFVQTENEIYGL